MTSWGMIGLGEMGHPMAMNLARAGFPLTVFDPRTEVMEEVVSAGAHSVDRPAAMAAQADVIGIVVRDENQIRHVLEGDDGLFHSGKQGMLVIVHSTIGPTACQNIAADAAKANVAILDAPISGMRMRAETGTLTFLVGGDTDDLEKARPGLSAMGERIFHLGSIGAGQVGKLANNLVSLSTVMVVAEGVALAEAGGVDEEDLIEVLQASSGDSWIVRNWEFIRHRWRREHPLGGNGVADMVGKDLRLAVRLGEELRLPLPSTAIASQLVPLLVGRDALFADNTPETNA